MRSSNVSTQLQRIAEQAVKYPERIFTTLVHLIDEELLLEAFKQTRKDGAAGIDKVTAKEYAENLAENLRNLHERLRSRDYKAPPVRRVWIDKEDGKKRPLGIPALEDKIVQRAGSMVMGAVYEQDFYEFSHGFRKGHSQHMALREIWERCGEINVKWILDADVSGFFDNIVHKYLREIIKQRINDGGILWLIGKWLNAGVMEEGIVTHPETGTPQGGVISPLLANIFLHHVLDEWFETTVKPIMKGRCFLVRYADDFIIGVEREDDARRIMAVLPKRFERFGLTIHPTKTKLVEFGRPVSNAGADKGNGTFDFLGFTHYWAKSRRGFWVIKRKTLGKRARRTMKAIWQWCRKNRHMDLKEQHKTLVMKLRGHYQYYGLICNYKMLAKVYESVKYAWKFWLSRRSRKGAIIWVKYRKLLTKLRLPPPKIVHNF